jgi:cell division protein FtsW (lipid II flippase)
MCARVCVCVCVCVCIYVLIVIMCKSKIQYEITFLLYHVFVLCIINIIISGKYRKYAFTAVEYI